jgi:hypothetical protein
MAISLRILAAVAVVSLPLAATSQSAADGSCILAGRLAQDGHWAPRFAGVELLGQDGKRVVGGRAALGGVRQARLAEPALLSRCDGGNPLANADNEPAFTKGPAPALTAGVVDVESVAVPKLRTGGELVELKVRYPAERVVMVTR